MSSGICICFFFFERISEPEWVTVQGSGDIRNKESRARLHFLNEDELSVDSH